MLALSVRSSLYLDINRVMYSDWMRRSIAGLTMNCVSVRRDGRLRLVRDAIEDLIHVSPPAPPRQSVALR